MCKYGFLKRVLATFVFLLAMGYTAAGGRTIYVDDDAPPGGNGQSWGTAYKYLQDALFVALSGDYIHVAQGIYRPDRNSTEPNGTIGTGDRGATFRLINGVNIKGGYAGFGEPNPSAWDVELYETILSGDLKGDDGPNFANNGENSINVVFGSGIDTTTELDGFTITAGNAFGPGLKVAGGMHNYSSSSPTVKNCTFSYNYAQKGAGMRNSSSSPTLVNCMFLGNRAVTVTSSAIGGAIWNIGGSNPKLFNCVFIENQATGGSSASGGAIFRGSPTLVNCIFIGNHARHAGGAMDCLYPKLTNCTFIGNSAHIVGGLSTVTPTLTNCIFWDNSDFGGKDQSAQVSGTPVVNYSCIQGWTGSLGGIGNIGLNPNINSDGHLFSGSPCINAGDPNFIPQPEETDIDGEPRVMGNRVDIGAHEFSLLTVLQPNGGELLVDGVTSRIIWVVQESVSEVLIEYSKDNGSSWIPVHPPNVGNNGYYDWVVPFLNLTKSQCLVRVSDSSDPNTSDVSDDVFTIINAGANGRVVPIQYSTIQAAIDDCNDGYSVIVIPGIYTGAGNRDLDFNGKAITVRSMEPNDPNIVATTIIDCNGTAAEPHRGFYFHNNEDAKSILAGLTIRNGFSSTGGGLCCEESGPTIRNCVISGNKAYNGGGGMYNISSSLTLTNCIFTGNSVIGLGYGGGVYNNNTNLTLINGLFSGNSAGSGNGGGIYTNSNSNLTLTNCTFSRNRSEAYGGGIYNSGSSLTLTNCILWGNNDSNGLDESAQIHGNTGMVSYSCIQGLDTFVGNNNINDEPQFVDADGFDDVAGTEDDDLRLIGISPCIDTGTNNPSGGLPDTDIEGNPRIVAGTVDMGAYEGPTQELLLSANSVIIPEGGTATFTIALRIDPNKTVEVTVGIESGGDTNITVEGGELLTFDSSNYWQPQTVTLAAATDGDYFHDTAVVLVTAPGFAAKTVMAKDNDLPPQSIIYVDLDAVGKDFGSSWADAYTKIQAAFTVASAFPDVVDEIRVAQGIYKPTDFPTPPPPPSSPLGYNNNQYAEATSLDREATFQLINGVAIKGGYAGFGEPDPNARDIEVYETVLSGDLLGDDIEAIRPEDLLDEPTRSENSYHVVNSGGTNATAVLDGFTITGGNAEASSDGGGMLCNSEPTVSNCTFTSNTAAYGGGISCFNVGSIPSPTFINCLFIGNSASEEGGGINIGYSDPKLTNCKISENFAGRNGGGFTFNGDNIIKLENCLLTGNSAVENGGAIHGIFSEFGCEIINCTVIGNSAGNLGGGVFYGTAYMKLTNCIFRANTPNEITYLYGNGPKIKYTNIQGSWQGEGNIDCDPCFVEQGHWDANGIWIEGEYHLKSESGRWDVNSQMWIQDSVTSSCIDTGDRNSNWTGELWPHGKRINMGVFGGTPQASMSLSHAGNIADVYVDGCIGYRDVILFLDKWLDETTLLAEDFDRSGFVNFADFTILTGNWGIPCEADNPNPVDGATDVDLIVDLSWAAGRGATSHDVYFGTSNPPPFTINNTVAIFDPGTMAPSTTYYWRIDEVGASGTTIGAVWSFTVMPLEASNPNPADGATVVNITSDLSWTASPCATSHDVYFGTSTPPPFICNQTATTFDPCTMTLDTTYYWRIDEVGAYGTITGTVWRFTTLGLPPGQAGNPNPADGATDVSVTTNVDWTAGSDTASHDVYFGTSNPPPFIGNQTATTYDPATMAYSTKHYWRIDEVNPSGTTTGIIWNFTTMLPPPPPPGPASNPNPADGATEVCIYADLGWTSGAGATSHDVYFGTSNPPSFIHNQTSTIFDPCTMDCNMTYYWRIDAVNISGKATGSVWSFTTTITPPLLPGQASNPNPADGATSVSINADLTWTAGSDTESHDVYFGTSNPPPFRGNQASVTFDPGIMNENTKYYWRIDEVNGSCKNTGTVWNFRTFGSPPPPPPPPI